MDTLPISILAFADDMAILADNNYNLQTIMNHVQQFCFFYGLDINYDEREKSVYTTFQTGDFDIMVRQLDCMKRCVDFFGKEYTPVVLPKLGKHESYKYLGIQLNLNLNYDKQHLISKQKLLRQLV